MKPDLQLEAHAALYEGARIEQPDVEELLCKQHPEFDRAQIREAVEVAKAACIADFNAPSTYECATPSEAGNAFSKHLLSAVPNISDGLLQKLVLSNMKSWLY